MSNLKKDITQMLVNLYSQAYADGAVGHSRSADILTAHQTIINLIESVIPEKKQGNQYYHDEHFSEGWNTAIKNIKSKLIRKLGK